MANTVKALPTVIVGHPLAPIGMGEHLRSTFRAMRAAGLPVQLLDVFGIPSPDAELRAELEPFLTDRVGVGTSVFCINGDEVDPILRHLGERAEGDRRIVYPHWELPRYPAEWARQLERFDEVWTASAYTQASIASSVSTPVRHLPLATQPRFSRPFGRRSFGIPEDCYAFLLFFDLQSYIERKNPYAALDAFRRVLQERPDLEVCLVVKTNGSGTRPEQARAFSDHIRPFGDRLVVLDRTMTDSEVKALHVCCDAFVSLHRSEGYGLGLAEAMCFGKPTVATGYSGNMDFMPREMTFLLDYKLVSVPEGAYPHAAGQVWADPDVEQAAAAMISLAEDPARGRALGAAASRHMRANFSYRAIGLRYAERLAGLASEVVPISMAPSADSVRPSNPAGAIPPFATSSAISAHVLSAMVIAEEAARERIGDVLEFLRVLSLDEFGMVMTAMPDPAFPKLSRLLPRMASPQVQRDWTGNDGIPLLLQTLSFVRSVDLNCVRLTGHGIRGRKLLDYGCGYGRILRLMYYYSAPERTFGVDPWDRSIEICRADGLPSTLSISDYLPNSLPVGNTRFGLIYAFSVFTHLSERATRAALKTLRMYVEGDGVLVITVRPREYWEVVAAHGHVNSTRMLSDHDERGFAFAPHDRAPVDGDVTYGDTSLTLDWLSVNAAGWRVAATDRRPDDPQQVIVFLVPT